MSTIPESPPLDERPLATAGTLAASAAGAALRRTVAHAGRLRPAAKPLHPRGLVLPATVHRFGAATPVGVPWLDEPGDDRALVRFSRGGGLPEALPDVLGIALRIDPDGRPGDLLFATTGHGPLGRFLLRPRRASTVAAVTYSTLQPYRTPAGAVVISARPERPTGSAMTIELAFARLTGRWQPFGTIAVAEGADGPASDADVSFDPFLNPVPGLANYGWTRRLREGAYAAARRSRRKGPDDVRVSDLHRVGDALGVSDLQRG